VTSKQEKKICAFEIIMDGSYENTPRLLIYNDIPIARFDIEGLQKRYGLDGAREFLDKAINEIGAANERT
jgi:hypothetical protein